MAEAERFPGVVAGFHLEADAGQRAVGLLHAGESWASSGYQVRRHTHRGLELYLQATGRTRWRAGAVEVDLAPGHVLAVPAGLAHALVEQPRRRHHFFYAALDLDRVAERQPGLVRAWQDVGVLHAAQGTSLEVPFRRLVREISHRLSHAGAGLSTALDAVVVEATRVLLAPGAGSLLPRANPAVVRARALLEERCAEPWTVPALAREVGLSTAHLSALFTEEVGLPPHRYLLGCRTRRAAELLAGTDLPVHAVARELSFSSAAHLSRVFRRLTGSSPLEHRRAAATSGPASLLGRGDGQLGGEQVQQQPRGDGLGGHEPGEDGELELRGLPR